MRLICGRLAAALLGAVAVPFFAADSQPLRTGKDALGDWTTDAPGVRRKITSDDLPPPDPKESVYNSPRIVAPPQAAKLHVPAGFQIEQIASGFRNPRFLLSAPNGDIFVTESHANQIKILHTENGVIRVELFADSGLNDPFGIAFYPPGDDPQFLYVANTNGVVRFPYRNGDLHARGPAQKLSAELSGGGLLPVAAIGRAISSSLPMAGKCMSQSDRARIIQTIPRNRIAPAFSNSIRTAQERRFLPGEFATPLVSHFAQGRASSG